MITAIEPQGPAAMAGLMSLDTIVRLDGMAITGVDDLIRMLNRERINRPAAVEAAPRAATLELKPLERPAVVTARAPAAIAS